MPAAPRDARWQASHRGVVPVVLSALLLVLAYPPYDLGLLGLVALIPWLRYLGTVPCLPAGRPQGDCPYRRSWWSGYALGLLYFGGTMWWLGYVTITGALVLVAYLACYPAAFGAFAVWALRQGAGAPLGRSAEG
ncbi:MAG: hypothetical protein HY600_01295, partial [Candidatus Omnitrophica bacterium]|nr:hypothetical protein [Candidatus Omnitrophota bacterium]